MKKLFAFILAIFLLLSFAGCAKNNPTTSPHDHTHSHTHTQDTTSTQATVFSQETVPHTHTNEINSESQNTENTQSTAHTEPDVLVLSDTLERGTIQGNTYTSNTLGLTFEKPSEWEFAQESDLAFYSGLSSGGLGDFKTTAQENPAVYDMYATHNESGSTASICYENLLITVGEALSAKEYAQIIKTAIHDSPQSSATEESEVTLGKRTYSKIVIKSTDGADNTTKTYYLTPVGNYMATIIVTLPEGTSLSADSLFR